MAGPFLQRLFSTFANGWPGKGLLVLRFTLAAFLVSNCLTHLTDTARLLAAITALFLIAGMWTPILGAATALLEAYIAFSQLGDPWPNILATAMAIGLALLGPGAHSVDSMAYGRRKISISKS